MDNTYKMKLVDSGLFKKTYSSKHEYRGRCPFCGHTGNKFYIRIDLDSDDPVMYNCFHCPAQGYLNYDLLERLGLENDIELPKDVKRMKKLPTDGIDSIPFNTVSENDNISKVSEFIYNRIGVRPSMNDLLSFQYIGNPSMYCSEYLGMDDINSLNDTKIWFKCTNGNMCGVDNNGWWKRYHSTRARDGTLYQMKTFVDIINDLNIIICDNIMDAIGLYYHYKELDNCMYVSTFGKLYYRGIQHMLNKGIFGKGVNIHIFKNKYVDSKKIYIDNNMRRLFGKIFIYNNSSEKEGYGVMKNDLMIQRIDRR